ncbi:hypothetical protein pb186bvf_015935 [Paramecium bursaria]
MQLILPKEPFLKNIIIIIKNIIISLGFPFITSQYKILMLKGFFTKIQAFQTKHQFKQEARLMIHQFFIGKSGIFQRTFDIYIFFINSISGLIVQSINNSFLKIMIKAKPFFVHQTSFTIIKIPFRLQKQLHSFIFIKSIIIGLQQFNISVDQNSSGFHKLLLFNLNGLKFLSKVSNDIRSLKQKFKIPFADANFKRFSSPSIKFIKIISHHFI